MSILTMFLAFGLSACRFPVSHDRIIGRIQFRHLGTVGCTVADVGMVELGEPETQLPDRRGRRCGVYPENPIRIDAWRKHDGRRGAQLGTKTGVYLVQFTLQPSCLPFKLLPLAIRGKDRNLLQL